MAKKHDELLREKATERLASTGIRVKGQETTKSTEPNQEPEVPESTEPNQGRQSQEGVLTDDDLAEDELELLDELEKLWAPTEAKSLEVRHQIGRMIVERYGEAGKERHLRGDFVMKEAANRLQMQVSEMSRMRWFATRWATFDDFTLHCPDVKSWTKVKELLATLRRSEVETSPATKQPKRSTEKQREAVVAKALALREEISQVKDEFSVKQLVTVEQVLEELIVEVESLAAPLKKPKSQG